MIRKTRGKDEWTLYSKDGSKKLGTYKTKAGAVKREQQVNYFKNESKTAQRRPKSMRRTRKA